MTSPCCSRRNFLGLSCSGYLAFAWGAAVLGAKQAFAQEASARKRVAKESWSYIERLSDGLYANISTPFKPGGGVDPTTFSNGGIIAGKERVVVIEGFNTTKGAAWQAEAAKEYAGKYPTHVVLTHFHPDHSNGLAGYQRGAESPAIISTAKTRELVIEVNTKVEPTEGGMVRANPLRAPDAVLANDAQPVTVDLGGRSVRLVTRRGHTPSDVTIEMDDPRVVFCGDLFFNGLFPFYGHATPTVLRKQVGQLYEEKFDMYVPGHGPVTDAKGLKRYMELLDHVEAAARKAIEAGTPAAEAWKSYVIPESMGTWTKFRPDVYRFGFEAWERELKK
ncbi:MAG: MBL fold metallo-hydrolase [Planctomycetota bacterium]